MFYKRKVAIGTEMTNLILKFFFYFSTGFCIPILTRAMAHSYPCTWHSCIGDILKYNFKDKIKEQSLHLIRFNLLKRQYFYSKILYGTLFSSIMLALEFFIKIRISESYPLTALSIFMFLLLFSAYIDSKYWIIPDVLTLPMTLTALFISIYSQKIGINNTFIQQPFISIISSIIIYILCTIIALFFYQRAPYSFGGGDVKLLTAIAAIAGVEGTGMILIGACALALPYCKIKSSRNVPLAPFAAASFIVWIFTKIMI